MPQQTLPTPSPDSYPVIALHPLLRAAVILARAAGALILVALALRVLLDIFIGDQQAPPKIVVSGVAIALALFLGAWLVQRFGRAGLAIARGPDRLILIRGARRTEAPADAVSSLTAWRLPLPGFGLAVRLIAGQRFARGLQLLNPMPPLATLAALPAFENLPLVLAPRLQAYAISRAGASKRQRRDRLLAFCLFPLLPLGIMFRAHQYIAWGGALGEYYALGFNAYVKTLAGYALGVTAHLIAFAALIRLVAELTALAFTAAAPARADKSRAEVELGCQILYYGGTLAVLGIAFLR